MEGEYELLDGGAWRVERGVAVHAARCSVHTFRNVGAVQGKMLIFATPSGIEKYLEEISTLSLSEGTEQLLAASERYEISFPQMTAD